MQLTSALLAIPLVAKLLRTWMKSLHDFKKKPSKSAAKLLESVRIMSSQILPHSWANSVGGVTKSCLLNS